MEERETGSRGMIAARSYRIRGRVQGVGYRYFALNNAIRLGVRGWVRNMPDRDVEVHAEADEETLGLFRQELENGPGLARVTEVIERETPVTGQYSSFFIRG